MIKDLQPVSPVNVNILTPSEKTLSHDDITKVLSDALRNVFDENIDTKRFIDVSRIPLICQNINGIHESIKTIESKLDDKYVTVEAFDPIRKLIYGLVGTILLAVISALLVTVLKR